MVLTGNLNQNLLYFIPGRYGDREGAVYEITLTTGNRIVSPGTARQGQIITGQGRLAVTLL